MNKAERLDKLETLLEEQMTMAVELREKARAKLENSKAELKAAEKLVETVRTKRREFRREHDR